MLPPLESTRMRITLAFPAESRPGSRRGWFADSRCSDRMGGIAVALPRGRVAGWSDGGHHLGDGGVPVSSPTHNLRSSPCLPHRGPCTAALKPLSTLLLRAKWPAGEHASMRDPSAGIGEMLPSRCPRPPLSPCSPRERPPAPLGVRGPRRTLAGAPPCTRPVVPIA